MPDLLRTLKTTFGYDTFRPLQREIIETSLADKDVFALLPTGGGKSLCFQLPALHRKGLTVVVSPLIALMKDQVDQLQAVGVAATFLNSTLGVKESKERLRGLHAGEWQILYAAPERLMLDNWKENLRAWNVTALAIDEAHCVSEWGHDFRPEYRQLAKLRALLPDIPVMALTATATERVRADVIKHLHLREPSVFVASFNRPNLTYRVVPKDQPLKQILEFLRRRQDESGIIYCASRATAERTAESLSKRGINAKPYHAGLTAKERNENQDLFLRDEVRIICATIAFGMGINKPNVRWIIHHDLPKNIESYYQETGRGGRDGLPGECLLLFSAGDAAKQTHFIDEMSDPREQDIARGQLRQMVHYAECSTCRRRELLTYFDEEYPSMQCDSCDNCLEPRDTYDGTQPAHKFLSCVYRIKQAGGFGVGINHVIEVLTGAQTEKIRRWNHDKLSTYGIGKEFARPEWAAIARELLRLGLLKQAEGEFPTLEISSKGADLLKARGSVILTKPMLVSKTRQPRKKDGDIECDEILLTRLKTLRKKLADEKQVPAYVIFGDTTLRQMAREYPDKKIAMRGIFGMGEKKFAEFSDIFSEAIADYLKENPKITFS
ncbi:MAG: DNA helicase RecQ [Chthoniobacterales bacterium]